MCYNQLSILCKFVGMCTTTSVWSLRLLPFEIGKRASISGQCIDSLTLIDIIFLVFFIKHFICVAFSTNSMQIVNFLKKKDTPEKTCHFYSKINFPNNNFELV